MTVYAKLAGGHRGAITALLPLGAAAPGGPDRLVSASADGSVAVWDPSRTPVRGAGREIAPAKAFKAHDSGVRSAALFAAYAGDKLQELPLRLATVGDDRRVALWDARTWQEVGRVQPLPGKASCNFVGFAPWGGAGLGVHPSLVLTSGESATVMGLDPGTKAAQPLVNLQGRIDPGQKKVPKIYHAAVHPTR
jgi:WD40 repeat protein